MSRSELAPGDLMSFLVATQTIQRSLGQMSLLFGQAIRGLSAGARVFEVSSQNSLASSGRGIISIWPWSFLKLK